MSNPVHKARLSRAGGARKVPARYSSSGNTPPALARALRAHRGGDLAAAIPQYEQHLAEVQDCLDGWLNLGSAFARKGNTAKAQHAFARASQLASDPVNSGRAWRDIGIGLATVGQLDAAQRALRQAVQSAPELVGAWMHLARVTLETSGGSEAAHAAQQAVQLAPHDPSAHFLLARCLFQHDHQGPAISALRRASEREAARPEASLLWRGLTIAKSGDPGGIPFNAGATKSVSAHDATESVSAQGAYADAIDYWLRNMHAARLFAGTRETLLFAASQATVSQPGHGRVIELGVRHGVSLRGLASTRNDIIHGFDSFVGLPESWLNAPAGTFSTDQEVPDDLLDAQRIQLWIGPFEEQLPKYVRQHPEKISLLHVDSDLYTSAQTGLTHLAPLLGPGSVIVFDEYFGHRTWRQDEYRAFQDACAIHSWQYEYLGANLFTGQAVVRLL